MSSNQALFAAVLDATSVKPEVKTWTRPLPQPGLLEGFTALPSLTSPHPQTSQTLHPSLQSSFTIRFHSYGVSLTVTQPISLKARTAKASFWNPRSPRGHQGFMQVLGFPKQLHAFNYFRLPTLWLKAGAISFLLYNQTGQNSCFSSFQY